jgi:hypothetical protein
MTTARERLLSFAEAERERLDSRKADILVAYTKQLRELLGFLEVTASEYADAAPAWWSSFDEFYASKQAAIEAQGGGEVEETYPALRGVRDDDDG